MKKIILAAVFLCLGVSGAAAQGNPIVYRARCGVKSAALADLETAMTRGLRYFVQANQIDVPNRSVAVRLVPAVGNQQAYRLRRSDLRDQWSIGANGELQFNSLTTDRCVKSYHVVVEGLRGAGFAAGVLADTIEVGGAYERILSSDEKTEILIKRRGSGR